jgi:hypothetical protein
MRLKDILINEGDKIDLLDMDKSMNESITDSTMYDMNLTRLMDACVVKIDDDYYDELADYLTDTEADLNKLNIDDLVVNSIQYLDKEDLAEEGEEDYYILKKDKKGAWIIN